VHRGFLGARATRVDPGVARNRVGLPVRAEPLVVGDQPAGPRILLVAAPDQLVLVVGVLGVRIDVRLLLGQVLLQRLAGTLLRGGRTEAVRTGPAVRRRHADIERIGHGVVVERVGSVEHTLVLDRVPFLGVLGGTVRAVVAVHADYGTAQRHPRVALG